MFGQTPFINPMMMPQPVPQPATQPIYGQWTMVNSYQDIEHAQVPGNGNPVIFMLANEPAFYLVSMQNGRKMVNGYTFTPMAVQSGATPNTAMTNPAPAQPPNPMESRLNTLEQNMQRLLSALGEGGTHGEPNPASPTA